MAFKSRRTSVQCRPSRRQLGRDTDPIISAVGDCRFDGRKTSKRNSEERLQRAGKRSRTSRSPSDSYSRPSREPSSANADSSASACTGSPDSSGSGETSSLSTPSSGAVLVTREIRTSSKRKSTSGDGEERPRKRSRGSPSPSDGPSHQALTEASCSNEPGSSSSGISRAAFEAKYEEGDLLGEGGFGSVFAGHRKADKLPVAIKHIPQRLVAHTLMHLDGNIHKVPLEVALLLALKPAAAGTSAVIELLDWYNEDDELILVLERPVPCMDLREYVCVRQSNLQEHEAKTIMKQLVAALVDVHAKGVAHWDIKPDNILMETGSDVPRVRIIDFGYGSFLTDGRHVTEQGTFYYTAPEFSLQRWCKAEPMAVLQVGQVLSELLDWCLPLDMSLIMSGEHDPHVSLSLECQDFLRSCLSESPEVQPSLETLRDHPWLK